MTGTGEGDIAPAKIPWRRRGGAVRDVASLATGTLVAQLILFAAEIPLSRLFGPGPNGLFATALSLATILGTIITLRLEMAIPLAETDEEAADLARVAFALSTLVALAMTAVVALLLVVPVPAVVEDALGSSLWVLPAATWATAVFFLLRMYQSRMQQFDRISRANVAGTLATAGSQLGAGAASPASVGLTGGYTLGRLLSCALMLRGTRLDLRGPVRWSLIGKWRQFPIWVLTPAVLNAVSVGAVTPLVAAFYGTVFAGHFAKAQRLLAAPAALLGQAVANVFFVKFAAMERDAQDTSRLMLRTAGALSAISVPVFLPFVLLGPELFAFALGAQWRTAGFAGALLAPWVMINFVSSPLSSYATVKDRVRRLFVLSLLEAGLRVPALALGMWWGGPLAGTAMFSLAGMVISGYWVFWVITLSGARWAEAVRVVLPSLLWLVLGGAATLWGRDLLGTGMYWVLCAVVIVAACAQSGLAILRARRR